MIERIVFSLKGRFGVEDDIAREAVHEGYLRMHGRKMKDEKARQHYWYITSKNILIEWLKKDGRSVELEEFHLPADYQPEKVKEPVVLPADIELNYIHQQLSFKDQILFQMIRNNLSFEMMADIFQTSQGNIRIMKHRLLKRIKGLLAFMLLPMMLFAQSMELVRPADFRYYVTADGDTVASRSLEYKAIQDGYMYKIMYPEKLIVIEPSGIEVRGFFSAIADTVYLPADTIKVETYVDAITKNYDPCYGFCDVPMHSALDSLNVEVRQAVSDTLGVYRVAVDGQTTASEISFATNCFGWNGKDRTQIINERGGGSDATDLHGYVRAESGDLRCQGIMTLWVTERDSGNFRVMFSDIGQILSLN